MPHGVFEHIVDYLPVPRTWQWSLQHLSRRTLLAPQQAAMDISILMDEMLADANIFLEKKQLHLVVKLNKNSMVLEQFFFIFVVGIDFFLILNNLVVPAH